MTHYVAIDALGHPADIGTDANGRSQYSLNVIAWKRPSDVFLREVMAILVGAGVGVEGQSIFGGSRVPVPTGHGPYLSLTATGGPAPLGTHNDGVRAYDRPTVKLIARASTDEAAVAMIQAAYAALIAVRTQAVSA